MECEEALRSIRLAKAELRKSAIAARTELSLQNPDAPQRLLSHLVGGITVPEHSVVSGFWPMGDELDIRPVLLHFHEQGNPCALPITGRKGTPLRFRRWTPETVMVDAVFGTREPPSTADLLEPDVLIVPLLAFDAAGRRLGYGAGYYDRTLAELRGRKPVLAVGVAYAGQEVAEVPHDASDEPLDYIVTERGLIQTRPSKA